MHEEKKKRKNKKKETTQWVFPNMLAQLHTTTI